MERMSSHSPLITPSPPLHDTTHSMGKLYHPNSPPHNDEPKSWSQNWTYYDPPAQIKGCQNNPTQGVHNITCTCTYTTKQEGGDTATSSSMDTPPECVDYSLATHAIARLQELTAPGQSQPWFLGVGLVLYCVAALDLAVEAPRTNPKRTPSLLAAPPPP